MITIIVLLILAGVSIAMLTGENGILTQAQNAKEETENAQAAEENILANYDSYINATTNGNTVYTDNAGQIAIIPKGFYIVPELDDINEGLVISDVENDIQNIGNQFVWVPVPNFTEFKREHFGTDSQKWWTGTFVVDKMLENNLYEPEGDGETNSTEVEQMYKSVKENKGFYIGRYEAGNDGANNAVSKKGINIYGYIPWGNSMMDETGGAVEKARDFDTKSGHTNVTSTLVYGVQWDAVMRWLSRGTPQEQGWLTDSTGKGNYNDNDDSNNPDKTGINDDYQMKNIYDLAGNASEWTMEADSTYRRVCRGRSLQLCCFR